MNEDFQPKGMRCWAYNVGFACVGRVVCLFISR